MSRDQNYLIYSSVCPLLNLIKINDDPLQQFQGNNTQRTILLNSNNDNYGVFSCQFSADGNEVLLGTKSNTIEIFDLNQHEISYRVENAHNDDINTTCFESDESPVIYSGSDDSSIKVWDKRMGGNKVAGVLIGHREGITCISSQNDGIHLISNGKDQCLKYWDIRTMTTREQYIQFRRTHRYHMQFNYMSRSYPLENYHKKLSEDSSILTFRGHKVLMTLIRCYFSPLTTTGQRFVYSGSADGKVFIYDTFTGKKVSVLETTNVDEDFGMGEDVCRDVSWHPYHPYIAATSFDQKITYFST
jgi:WD repeat-containing protein 23